MKKELIKLLYLIEDDELIRFLYQYAKTYISLKQKKKKGLE